MARLALVDASAGTATALRAAAGDHDVLACGADAVPPDAALVVLDAGGAPPAPGLLARLSGRPLLVLVDRRVKLDGTQPWSFLRKPCEIVELRARIEAMLNAPGGQASAPGNDFLPAGLRLPRAAASLLAAARHLAGPVWLAGEPGTGAEPAAAALARAWDGGRAPVIWQDDEDLDAAGSRLLDAGRVLWAPALDERSPSARRAFERLVATAPGRRFVVTTADGADDSWLTPSLHRLLSRVALRVAPLRERTDEVASLALETGSSVAAAAFGGARFELAESARRSLEAYEWPGNLDELDAVITRSVLARGAAAGVVELAEADLRYAPGFANADFGSRGFEAPAPRRAVVLPMPSPRGSDNAFAAEMQVAAAAGLSSGASSSDAGVEAVLSAFAHDLRNPMATLKTFATLAAAEAGDDSSELARLATGAAERIDAHLEFLQRYTELATGAASPATSRVDAVDVLGDAIDAAGADLQMDARSPLWTSGDPEAIRFIADAVVAERSDRGSDAAARDEGEATVDLSADKRSIEFRIPVGGAAVDRLGKWVESRGLPWRLALARDLARRGGGDLQLIVDTVEDGEMRVRWTPAPSAEEAEVGRDGGQARSADRRRRSRSS